jgi:4-amino-4-deoxy-L-arabinose transferase-like glycosyltransferase
VTPTITGHPPFAAAPRARARQSGEVCLLVIALAAAVFFIGIGIDRPIWHDDAHATFMAKQDFRSLLHELRNDNNLPAFHTLLWASLRVFGDSEPALRSIAAFFYLAGAGICALLAWSVYRNRRAALFAGVLYLSSIQLIRQAHSVRMYSMLGALSALSLLLYIRIFLEGRRRPLLYASFWLVNTIGLLTQVWFFFVLLAEGLFHLARRRDRMRMIALLAASGLVFVILWGPTFLAQLHNGSTHWFPSFHPSFFIDVFVQFYGFRGLAVLLFAACALAVALGERGAVREFWRGEPTRLLLLAAATCVAVPLMVSIFKPIYYPGRYTTVALPPLVVLLGAVLSRFVPRVPALVLCLVMLAGAGAAAVLTRGGTTFPNLPPEQSDRTTAAYLAGHAARGDAVVFTSLTRPTADYYFTRLGASGRFFETSFPREIDDHGGWRDNRAMLARREALRAEASGLATRLAQLAREGHRVWLYYGLDREVSDILKPMLDEKLLLTSRHALRGPCHNFLIEYAAGPENAR